MKRAFNQATKSYKKALQKARLGRIAKNDKMLSVRPTGTRAFWSLAKAIESNFCQPSLSAMLKLDISLARTGTEKANVFAALFSENLHLDTGNVSLACLPYCGISMPEIRITNKEIWTALCSLDFNKANGPDGIPAILLKTCAAWGSPHSVFEYVLVVCPGNPYLVRGNAVASSGAKSQETILCGIEVTENE